jgi:uncharacterized protein
MISPSSTDTSPLATALSDADLDEWGQLLAAGWAPEETMDLEEIDGLLAGMLCGPRLVLPSAAIATIFGDEEPAWPDQRTVERFHELLLRRWNEIASALDAPIERLDDPRAYVPLMTEWDDSEEAIQKALAAGEIDRLPQYGELWALGFMHAVTMTQDDWNDLPKDDDEGAQMVEEALSAIMALVPDEDDPETGMSIDERDEMVADALVAVYDMRDYWKQVNFERGRNKEPVRRAPKIGRNDPCPCGSGKKFKACCGREH